jgi:hypothetical protein
VYVYLPRHLHESALQVIYLVLLLVLEGVIVVPRLAAILLEANDVDVLLHSLTRVDVDVIIEGVDFLSHEVIEFYVMFVYVPN